MDTGRCRVRISSEGNRIRRAARDRNGESASEQLLWIRTRASLGGAVEPCIPGPIGAGPCTVRHHPELAVPRGRILRVEQRHPGSLTAAVVCKRQDRGAGVGGLRKGELRRVGHVAAVFAGSGHVALDGAVQPDVNSHHRSTRDCQVTLGHEARGRPHLLSFDFSRCRQLIVARDSRGMCCRRLRERRR